MQAYHDTEWGVPIHEERALFELLTLEGAQAGLSWATILARRDGYRRAFANFDIATVATFGSDDQTRLKHDPGIIRNAAKIRSAIWNARLALELADAGGSLDAHLWSFVGGRPLQNRFSGHDIPAQTAESKEMSRDLKRRGFSFVGPTICYAFMQSAGLVNDHTVDCFRHDEVARLA
jgi:DNA-3-methyladenine glycosylase I